MIPKNLEECFVELEKILSKNDFDYIKNLSKQDVIILHHTLGRKIRNDWNLWHGGPLKEYFKLLGLEHADDISMLIINCFWNHLHNQPLEISEQIHEYQKYWSELDESAKQK